MFTDVAILIIRCSLRSTPKITEPIIFYTGKAQARMQNDVMAFSKTKIVVKSTTRNTHLSIIIIFILKSLPRRR